MKKLLLFLFAVLIISCDKPSTNNSSSINNYLELKNSYNRITLILPSVYSDSSEISYPYQGFKIINKKLQLYGFISIKDFDQKKLDNKTTVENILSSNWDRFTKNWDNYLNIKNIQINTPVIGDSISHDANNNILRTRTFKIVFPQLFDIDTAQVGNYIIRTLSSFDINNSISIPEHSTDWINFNEYYGILTISIIPPSMTGTGGSKIIISAFITLNKDISSDVTLFYNTINSRNSLCFGSCKLNKISENMTIPETKKPISVLVLYKNKSSMQLERTALISNFWEKLYSLQQNYNIDLKIAATTLSEPETFITYNNISYVTNNDSLETWQNYFNIPITTSRERDSMLDTGLKSIEYAKTSGFFKPSETNVIILITDQDDQSLISGEAVSMETVDYFVEEYKKNGVIPFGLIGTENMTGTNCNNTENSTILKRFFFLINGRYNNICSSYNTSFINKTFFRRIFYFNSPIKSTYFPIYYLSDFFVNNNKTPWLDQTGYYASAETNSILFIPLLESTDKVKLDYYYFK